MEKLFHTPANGNERELSLQPNEILTEIVIPGGSSANATYEVRQRNLMDWPLAAAAVSIKMSGSNVESARTLVVGEDAPANAAPLLDLLRTYPAVSGQVEAAVRVSGRRWNLRLRNGIDIRLPAEDVAAALDRLAEYQREHALFERDVIAVDLRMPDRLIVRVSGKAADRARAGGENT